MVTYENTKLGSLVYLSSQLPVVTSHFVPQWKFMPLGTFSRLLFEMFTRDFSVNHYTVKKVDWKKLVTLPEKIASKL